MYKTIRHGENSLQYTILPQNDDFRLDGKISGNGNNGGHKTKRGKKRSFFAYLGLIFVCTVLLGAVLIPFLVSVECLPNPSDWFLKAKVALTRHDLIINKDNITNNISNDSNKTESTINKAYLDSHNQQTQIVVETVDNNNNNNNNNKIPATTVQGDTNNNNVDVTSSLSSSDNIIYPTSNSRKKVLNSQRYNVFPTKGIVNDDSDQNNNLFTTKNLKLLNSTIKTTTSTTPRTKTTTTTKATTTTSIISTTIKEVALFKDNTTDNSEKNFISMTTTIPQTSTLLLMKISTKKPIILPVLAKTNSVTRENGKLIDRHEETKNWIKSHWPFIDPTSYFQWAGYKSEDSVLLPAILGLALIGLVLILTLCLIVRHKNKIDSIVRKRNRNNTEEAGEDNTTLLTTGNTSDDE